MEDFLNRISGYSPKRLALLADELQRRVSELEDAAHAPIAIVGMACRFPGGADTPEKYWQLLIGQSDAIDEVPQERWNIDQYFDPNPDAPGKMSSRWGGFLTGVDGFDAHFFGISPREAQRMDPQHRLLLEVAWEALERAGLSADRLLGSRTGVYVGMSSVDYLQVMRAAGLSSFDAYTASGAAHSIASGRLSYLLGTRGPSMTIDTACSSSLVAVHQAVLSLRRRESDLALAGGVNLILRPDVTVALSKAHMMAPDGRCKTFDARADGFVRSEGCGVVVLKRLADAQADGDRIVAVIRGTASNQDGRSNGLTAPNGAAQEAVVRAALDDARLAAGAVDYIEAHGTGTSLGDPIEVQALAAVFGAGRLADRPLWVGSVKANIGHLESSAGVASLIKLALVLEHGQIPGQLHFVEPNPFIPWEDIALRVPRETTPLPASPDGVHFGGTSSFGFSGTNVHVLMSSAPAPAPVAQRDLPERPRHILTLSARSEVARDALLTDYRKELEKPGGPALADFAFTANTGRASLTHRAAVVATTREEAALSLVELSSGAAPPSSCAGVVPTRSPRIAFLFSGQGAQYAGMARSLYETQPYFREVLLECEAALRPQLAVPLLSVLYPQNSADSPIHDTAYTQPALFAVEYALAKLWQSFGVQPSAVLGHSLGEYVAACIAGVISLPDALRLVAERGRLMSSLPRDGAMAALMADETSVNTLIAPWQNEVAIAALNGPEHLVVSGRNEAVIAILERAATAGISSTRLTVSHAFHSHLVEPMLGELERIASGVSFRPPTIDVVSNVTGERHGSQSFTASYVREHARRPVQFLRSIQSLASLGYDTFVEIGPQPTLLGMARQCLPEGARSWLPSLRRGGDDWTTLLDSVAKLYVRGVDVDWAGFDRGYARNKVLLPTYPFQRTRFWVDVAANAVEPEPRTEPDVAAASAAPVALAHAIVWRDGPVPGGALPSPAAVRDIVSPLIAETASEAGLDGYQAFMIGLDALSTLYIANALRELGAQLEVGATFDGPALAAELGVIPRHARLFARLLQILVEDGLLAGDDAGFRVLAPLPTAAPDPFAETLRVRHPEGAAELTLTSRCARELARVLRGTTDPLPLLFPGGSLADMEQLYRSSPPARTYNGLIGRLVLALERSRSEERPLRVLEIGGGTGSTTAHVLPQLRDDRVSYTFTDLSPLFLNRARERFADRACVQFSVLDLSIDPQSQGFVPGSFDLIIGANVVHATPDIGQSLQHARRLLSPGGEIVLLEGTTPRRFGDLTVGLLEGWWAFTDLQRRSYALMPRQAWLAAFRESGFESASVIVEADAGPVLEQQAIFVAQAPVTLPVASGARWLIVDGAEATTNALSRELASLGQSASVITGGASTLRDALSLADAGREPIAGVIQLATLDVELDDATSASRLWADQERIIGNALATVHALVDRANAGHATKLCFVTRGAQATRADEPSNPAQASIWGLTHVVALEHPELACQRIDLDGARPVHESLRALALELASAVTDDQVALRGQRRKLRRLVPQPDDGSRRTLEIRADRSYLITGGLRGLGLLVASWLVQRGARSLVLMSRRPADGAANAEIERLRERGAQISIRTGDVSNEATVAGLFDEIATTLPPLAGIIHAAGVLDDGALVSQTWARFAAVLAPKVLGSWHLHRMAPPLDFFALFSSGAAIAGSAGQANHAAANAFEDALAWYRQAHGQPTVSINWGPWAEVGAAVDRNVSGPSFVSLIAPRQGLQALERALTRDPESARLSRAQVVAIAADWSQLAHAPLAWRKAALFRELAPPRERVPLAKASEPTKPEQTLRERLLMMAENRRRAALQEHVRDLTVQVLGAQRQGPFDVHEPLRQLGLDSLMAVELRNLLAKAVGRAMPATITFDYPSVNALSEYIAADFFGEELFVTAAKVNPEPSHSEGSDDHQELSSDELAARLAERLDRIFEEESQ